ncbi:MAG: antibiotic ABC transporter [Gemmobacter sp.]|nr:antibiotic ABC transporter [Gemmobacter sp.]
MRNPNHAAEFMKLWTESCFMAVEAQMVIGMRLAGIAGFWNVTKAENNVMRTEKIAAAQASALAATTALSGGSTPAGIVLAAMEPVRRKTMANSRRLAKRGVKFGV